MTARSQLPRIIGGILLVAGTTVGAAMLAFPVTTGLAGLIPSLLLFLLCWIYLTYTAFLFIEAALWFKKEVNLISLARQTLGRVGVIGTWCTYLFLLYALLTAYIAGSGPILNDVIGVFADLALPQGAAALLLLGLLSFAIYRGTSAVDYLNRILMAGLVIAFIAMITITFPHVDSARFREVHLSSVLLSVPIVATAFGFHIVIPSLATYLQWDKKSLIWVVTIGSAIPLVMYTLWEIVALGGIPINGDNGLLAGYAQGDNAAHLLSEQFHEHQHILAAVVIFFSFCAIITSFLGVALSLCHFLSDGLKIKERGLGGLMLCALTFLPPAIIAGTNPRIFLSALDYAGAFGITLLLGILPALVIWRGRYYYQFPSTFQVAGGKPALVAVILFSLAIIAITTLQQVM
jgi:tyrosine-specific transport protein